MGSTQAGLKRASGINHVAFRCRDAEQTRWFYSEVLGLPLSAALVAEKVPGLGDEIPYMHLFFELGNGEFVAFFDQPETADPRQFERAHSFERHLAPRESALYVGEVEYTRLSAFGWLYACCARLAGSPLPLSSGGRVAAAVG